MGVDEVEALAAQQGAQPADGGEVVGAAAREAEFLDLDAAGADLGDLVADPAAALRRRLVGYEVGDDEDAHRGRLSAPGAGTETPPYAEINTPSPPGLLESPVRCARRVPRSLPSSPQRC